MTFWALNVYIEHNVYTSGHAGFDSPPHVKVKGTAVKKQMEINKWSKI